MTTKIYRDLEREQGKEARKEEIVSISREMFLQKGYVQTNMADIAQQAKISRKTLYRYFSSKEEIAMEIELSVFKTFIDVQSVFVQELKGTGYEKLKGYLQKLDQMVDDYSPLIRLTGMFDYYFVDDYPGTQGHRTFVELIEKVDQPFVDMISEGVLDGSVQLGVDTSYVARTISNSFLALAQRIVTRQSHLNEEQHIDSRKILTLQMELFLKAIKA